MKTFYNHEFKNLKLKHFESLDIKIFWTLSSKEKIISIDFESFLLPLNLYKNRKWSLMTSLLFNWKCFFFSCHSYKTAKSLATTSEFGNFIFLRLLCYFFNKSVIKTVKHSIAHRGFWSLRACHLMVISRWIWTKWKRKLISITWEFLYISDVEGKTVMQFRCWYNDLERELSNKYLGFHPYQCWI